MSNDKVYKDSDIVWVKLGSNWWPGEVVGTERQPDDLTKGLKIKPYCVVKFFDEDSYELVKNAKGIFPFQCKRKEEFKKKGHALHAKKLRFMEKFPQDVATAERLTRGVAAKSDIVIINDRPDSIVKAIIGNSVPHGTANYNFNNNSTRRDAVTKILNLTPTRPELKIPERSMTSTSINSINCSPASATSTFSTSAINQSLRSPVSQSTPSMISIRSSSSSIGSGGYNAASTYHCNLCDFTTTRQNVLILHRKSHNYTSPKVVTPAACRTGGAAVKNLTNTDFRSDSSLIATTHSTPVSPTAVEAALSPHQLKKSEHVTTAAFISRRSNSSTRSRHSTNIDIDLMLSTCNEQRMQALCVSDEVPSTSSACGRTTSASNAAPASAVNVQRRNSEEIRQSLLADWSDADVEDEDDDNEFVGTSTSTAIKLKPIDANLAASFNASVDDAEIRATTSTAALAALETATPSVSITNKSQRIRNIPKKDRRDVILSEFNNDVNNFSSNSTTAASSVASTPPIVMNMDVGCNNSNSSDCVVVIEANTKTTSTIPAATNDKPTQVDSEPITSASASTSTSAAATANAAILSCFDFQEDEDDTDNDVLTSIANLRKKLTPEKVPSSSASKQQAESKALKQKQNDIERQDKQLAAEINLLLEETVVGSVVKTGNGEDVSSNATVKAFPIKERGKRIFKSRNRSRVDEDEVGVEENRNQSIESVEQLPKGEEEVHVEEAPKARARVRKSSRVATPKPKHSEEQHLNNGNNVNNDEKEGEMAAIHNNTKQLENQHEENSFNGFHAVLREDVTTPPPQQTAPLECLMLNTPTDETSSLGISEAGAEFGSPTSMLSDERLLSSHNLLTPVDDGLQQLIKSPGPRKEGHKEASENLDNSFISFGQSETEHRDGDDEVVYEVTETGTMLMDDTDDESDSPPFEAFSDNELDEKEETLIESKQRSPVKKSPKAHVGISKKRMSSSPSSRVIEEEPNVQRRKTRGASNASVVGITAVTDVKVSEAVEEVDSIKMTQELEKVKEVETTGNVETVQQDNSDNTKPVAEACTRTPVEIIDTVETEKQTKSRSRGARATTVATTRAPTPVETMENVGMTETVNQNNRRSCGTRASAVLKTCPPTSMATIETVEQMKIMDIGDTAETISTEVVDTAEKITTEVVDMAEMAKQKKRRPRSSGMSASAVACTSPPVEALQTLETAEIVDTAKIAKQEKPSRSRGTRALASATTPVAPIEAGELLEIEAVQEEHKFDTTEKAKHEKKQSSRGTRASTRTQTPTPVEAVETRELLATEVVQEEMKRRSHGTRESTAATSRTPTLVKAAETVELRTTDVVQEEKNLETADTTKQEKKRLSHDKHASAVATTHTPTPVEAVETRELLKIEAVQQEKKRRSRDTPVSAAATMRTPTPMEALNKVECMEVVKIGNAIETVQQENSISSGKRAPTQRKSKTPPVALEQKHDNVAIKQHLSGRASATPAAETTPPKSPIIGEAQKIQKLEEQVENTTHKTKVSPTTDAETQQHQRKRRSHLKITPRRRLSDIETRTTDNKEMNIEPKKQKQHTREPIPENSTTADGIEKVEHKVGEYEVKSIVEKSSVENNVERKSSVEKGAEKFVSQKSVEKTSEPQKPTGTSIVQKLVQLNKSAEEDNKIEASLINPTKLVKKKHTSANIATPATATSPTATDGKPAGTLSTAITTPASSKNDDDNYQIEFIEVSDSEAAEHKAELDRRPKITMKFIKKVAGKDYDNERDAIKTKSHESAQKQKYHKELLGSQWLSTSPIEVESKSALKKDQNLNVTTHEEKKSIDNDVANALTERNKYKQKPAPKVSSIKRLSDEADNEANDLKRRKSFEDDIPTFVIERPSSAITTKKEKTVAQMQRKSPKLKEAGKLVKNDNKVAGARKDRVATTIAAVSSSSPEQAVDTFDLDNMPFVIDDGTSNTADDKQSKISNYTQLQSTAHLPELPRIIQHTIIKPADNPVFLMQQQQQKPQEKLRQLSSKRTSPTNASAHNLAKVAKIDGSAHVAQKQQEKKPSTTTSSSFNSSSHNNNNTKSTNKQIGMDMRGNKYVIIKTDLPLQQQQQLMPLSSTRKTSGGSSDDSSSIQTSTSITTATTSKPKSPAAAATGGRKQAGNTITLPSGGAVKPTIKKRQQNFSDQLAAVDEAMQLQYQQQKQEKQRQLMARRGSLQSHQLQQQLLKHTSAGASVANQRRQSANADLTSNLTLKRSYSTTTTTSLSSSFSTTSHSPITAIQQRITEHPLHNRTPKKQPQQHRNLQRKSWTTVVATTSLTPPLTLNTHALQRQLSHETQEQYQHGVQQPQVELGQEPEQVNKKEQLPTTLITTTTTTLITTTTTTTPVLSTSTSTTIDEEQITEGTVNIAAQIATEEPQPAEGPKANILAVPTQSIIPGFTETFLLCTLIDNKYKPIDNVPLYLDHESNQLVPVPEEAMIGLPNLILSQTSPEETVNQMQPNSTTQPICLQPVIEDGAVSLDVQQQVGEQLLGVGGEPITEETCVEDVADGSVVVGQMENYVAGEPDSEIIPGNSVILSIQGQQLILDAATFAQLLANPDGNTPTLVTDDGTEFLLTRELLAALEAQQQEAAEQEQQQQFVGTNTAEGGGAATDILAVALAGTDLYGSEVLEIETSHGLQLVAADGNIMFSPSGLPQPHLTPPITAQTSETNVNQKPIMSTLEKPSTVLGKHKTAAEIDDSDLTTCQRPNLDDSLAVIGVTAPSSTVPPSLELPITITNPAIAPKVTMANVPTPSELVLQLESRIFNDPDS